MAQGATHRPLLTSLSDRLLDLVFPPRCVSCNAFGAFICSGCQATMTAAGGARCPTCWMPRRAGGARESAHPCGRCRHTAPAFNAVRAVYVYEGPARDAVHALKYRGVSAVAREMASSMATALQAWSPLVTVVMPVPIAGHRRRLRGYNQTELLAAEVARDSRLPLVRRALRKCLSTAPQVQQPDEEARRRNVAGSFNCRGRPPAGGVLLIDDVITTGATLDACARVLLNAGSGPVFALTFARED